MNAAPGTEPRALASGRHAAWSRPLANARGSVLSSRYARNRLFPWGIAMPFTFMLHTPAAVAPLCQRDGAEKAGEDGQRKGDRGSRSAALRIRVRRIPGVVCRTRCRSVG